MQKRVTFLRIVIIILTLVVVVFSVAVVSLYKTVDKLSYHDISSMINSSDVNIDEINKRLDDVSKRIESLNTNISNHEDGLDTNNVLINKDIESLKDDINALYSKNNINSKQNSYSNNEIEELKNKLSLLQATINSQNNEINELKAANTNQVIGAIVAYAGNDLPDNYLECNGQEVSRDDYADLFTVIGTTYGEGDGTTTFNLPNLMDKFPMSSSTKTIGTFISPGIPNITGSIFENPYPVNPGNSSFSGAFKNSAVGASNGWADGSAGRKPVNTKNFSAADGEVHNVGGVDTYRNDVYGKSDTVQPPALVIKYIIKVKK